MSAMPRLVGNDHKVVAVEGDNHWHQFVRGVRDGDKPSANFDYAGPLTEPCSSAASPRASPQELKWDAAALKFTNVEAANQYVRRTYRSGWEKWS